MLSNRLADKAIGSGGWRVAWSAQPTRRPETDMGVS